MQVRSVSTRYGVYAAAQPGWSELALQPGLGARAVSVGLRRLLDAVPCLLHIGRDVSWGLAASQVGDAAQKVGNAAQDAADNMKKQ